MRKLHSYIFAVCFLAVMPGMADAALVGVTVTQPVISYVNTAATATRYDPISQIFAVDATPSTIQFSPTDPTLTVLPPRSMAIRIQVDNTGALIGGVPGNDLVISGQVQRIVGGVTNIYSGQLLTGEVTAFGSFDSGGTVDSYDFRFNPTGGLLLQFFQCDHIGVTLTSESSTFTGSFTTNFNGHAKGNVGLEDTTPPTVTCPYGDNGNATNVQCSASSGGQHGAFVTYPDPTGSDNCDTNLMFVYTPPSGSFFALNPEDISTNYVVTLTATDFSGNQSSCSFTVTVEDTLAPVLDVNNPIIGECGEVPFMLTNDTGACSAAFTFAKPTAVDECCTNGVHVTVSAIDQTGAVILLADNGDGTLTGHFPVTCGGSNVITSVAADGRGNTSQRQCAVYVIDIQPPSITCTDQVVECTGGPINFQEPRSFDNCPNLTVTSTPTNGSFLAIGTNQIVSIAVDCSGNTNECAFNVIVQDTTPPAISCPTNITVQCGQPTDPSNTGSATATDTCDSNPTVTFTDSSSGTCPVTLSRTWLATDHSGNTNQCVQIITITNATPPTVTVPTGSFLGCNPTNPPSDTSVKALVTATDTCSTPIVTVTHVDGSNGCTVTRTFTVTAADACNNPSAPQTVVYTWTADTTPPTVTVPTGSNLGCNPTNLPTDVSVKAQVTASDTCSTPVVAVSHVDTTNSCTVTRTFTVTAADACNNACAPKTVVYTWTADTTPPTVTVPTGLFLGCNPTNQPSDASVKLLVTATDACSTPVATVSHADTTNGCTVTRTFTVTAADTCNNVSAPKTVAYTWTADTKAPTITVPTGSNLGCNPATLPTIASVKALVTATDSCSVATVNVSSVDTSNGCTVTRTFTVTATDGCGNTSATQTVAYTWTADTTGPTLSGCTNQVVYQQQTVTNGQVCIKDVFNCQPITKGNWIWFNGTLNPCTGITNRTYTVNITGQTITGTIGGSNVSLTVPNAQITYSSTTTNAITTFTNGVWVTTCPLASTLAGDQFGSGLPYQLPFNSSGNGTLTWCATFGVTPGVSVNWHWAASVYTNFSATCTALGVKPVDDNKACSYKNSDSACTPENFKPYCVFGARSGIYGNYCGNRTFPWVCNKGTTTVCSGGVVQYTPPTVSSTCGGVPNLVCVPQPGVGFVTGSTNIICTAIDDCGSTNSCSFKVTLQSPLPTIACPGNITTNTTTTSCSQVVKWTVTGSSACGGSVTTSCSPTNGSMFAKGTTPVTCMAVQSGAGTNSCSFTVTVNDTIKPTITCPANITTNACTAVVTFAPTVSDNCPGVTYSCIPASGSTFAYGTNTVTCTATDTSGNTANCSFKVILKSAVAPCMVSNPTATAGSGKVTVTWSAESMGTAPFTYTVKRATTSGGSYTTVATGITTLTCTDTAVVHGTRYYYVVTASNCVSTSANSAQTYCTP